jgi:hypothetical protein
MKVKVEREEEEEENVFYVIILMNSILFLMQYRDLCMGESNATKA